MSPRRRRTTTLAALAALACAGALAIACGIDAVATKDNIIPGADTGDEPTVVLPETGPIPEGGPMPDAPLDHDAEAGCPGDAMVVVALDASTFCIDSTEVTNAEYARFVASTDGGTVDSGVFDGAPPSGCATNSYGIVLGTNTLPANANWCDAYTYCAWAGKRLCGKTVAADASTGEWYGACSKGGTQLYPYGSSYVSNACNDTSGSVAPVGSHAQCEGSVPGLFDMVGNVSELIDSCVADDCAIIGGFYAGMGECTSSATVPKSTAAGFIGFRCCGDLR